MTQPSRPSPSEPVTFACGATMKNRFMLAPMTNHQSHEDGRLGDDELHWLTRRAEGNFGLTMTCAAHVQAEEGVSWSVGDLFGCPLRRPCAFGGGHSSPWQLGCGAVAPCGHAVPPCLD